MTRVTLLMIDEEASTPVEEVVFVLMIPTSILPTRIDTVNTTVEKIILSAVF